MNKLFLTIIILLQALNVTAKSVKGKKTNSSLSTDIKFSGSRVSGKYNIPGESVVNIEDDKQINSLLVIPPNFQQRIKESLTRE